MQGDPAGRGQRTIAVIRIGEGMRGTACGRGVEVYPDGELRVRVQRDGGGVDHLHVDTGGAVVIGQAANAGAATVAIDQCLAVPETMRALKMNRVGNPVDLRDGANRRADRMPGPGGRAAIEIDEHAVQRVLARFRQTDGGGIDDDDVVVGLVGQPADALAAAVAVDHPLAGREAVAVAQVDRFGAACAGRGHGAGRRDRRAQRMRRAGGARKGQVGDAAGAVGRVGRELDGGAADQGDVIRLPLHQAADAAATAIAVDDGRAVLEAVLVTEIDAVGGFVHGIGGREGDTETVLRAGHAGEREVDGKRFVLQRRCLGGRQLEGVRIGRVGDRIVRAAIDQAADRGAAGTGVIHQRLTGLEAMGVASIDAVGGPDHRRGRVEQPGEVVADPDNPERV